MRNAWLGVVLAAAFSGGTAVAADEGLVAWWGFNEGEGTVVADASPNQLKGTLKGGAQWVDGVVGKAVSFNGTNASVEVQADPKLDLKDATLEAWFFVRKRGGGISFDKGTSWTDERFVLHFRDVTKDPAAPPSLTISDGKAYFTLTPKCALPLNTWCHIAVTRGEGMMKFYLDGVVQAVSKSAVTPDTKEINLSIGRTHGLNPDFLDGVIDEVRIYSRALSDAEIAEHAKPPAGAPK